MVLIIDNYDSFTFNLVQYLAELGASVEIYRNDVITVHDILRLSPSHIIISPGPGRPCEAGISVELVRELAGRIPILGVCLGHQAIAEAFGGRVVRAEVLVHGKTSDIYHDGATIFQGVGNPFKATRYHSLVVDSETLPACLQVSARTSDGLIMGFRHLVKSVEGVQFHPESILTAEGKRILGNYLGMARQDKAVAGDPQGSC